ncbi:MAG: hypothetical protein HYU52_00035 [Acidobacteria bacterium]|nr:hypothetical protein [Acidobacteriota bacterium]
MNGSSGVVPKPQSLRLIWVAMCISVIVYGVVAFLVSRATVSEREGFQRGDFFADPLVIALHLAGFGAIAAGFVLPGIMLRARQARDPLTPPQQPGAPFVLTASVMQAVMIRFALCESAGVMGLVLAFVTGTPWMFVPLGLASLSALLLSHPAEDKLREFDETVRGPR